MIHIQPAIVKGIQSANKLEDLFPVLQSAVELEHATIPAYLTAMFSFKEGKGENITKVIQSIVVEEMLHMTIACNILNAIGGSPAINKKEFVPNYPCPLPMGIGDGLQVGLAAYSPEVVKNVFMEIEEPEHPLILKEKANAFTDDTSFHTIGDFYNAIIDKLNELAPDTLPGDPAKQVTDAFTKEELFPIIKKEDAIKAINIIIEQGEGTQKSPVDFDAEIAHYYKFEELWKGITLVKDSNAPYGYSFSGDKIPFDTDDVLPLYPNTKVAMLPKGSEERKTADEFNNSYNTLLNTLHDTFNGNPSMLNQTFGMMFSLKKTAAKLCTMPFPGKEGYTIGPPFECTSL